MIFNNKFGKTFSKLRIMTYCEFIECSNRAVYGFPNEKPKFCKFHKENNMKYIYGIKFCPCGKRPYFGFHEDEKATCCVSCKKDGMIDIVSKKCPCGKRPYFGFLEDKKPTCCGGCKQDGMIDIKHKKCPCGKRPYFGFLKDKKPTCCVSCKKDGMTNIISKKCPCGKTPYFGFSEDKKASCCVNCKKDGMTNIRDKKCPCGSGKRPIYGFAGDKRASCCIECKKGEMENIHNKKCKANERGFMCPTERNPYYDGFCTHCFAHLFPRHPKTTNIRKNYKELKVVHYISSRYEGFLHDKPLYVNLSGGCCPSKRRIDLRKLIGNTMLCIEIDERQHRGYCQIDEENRYNDLFVDFSGKYIFIRYNPDKYKDKKGKRRNPKFETRMEMLENEIEKHTSRIDREENKELLEIHHLYYDVIDTYEVHNQY